MLRSEQERIERGKKDTAHRKASWDALLKQLRLSNPTQKIVFRERSEYRAYVVADGTAVEVRLDREVPGGRGSWYSDRDGRYYFTVGGYRRHTTRPRAVEKKTGFDWARIAQLVEEERLRAVRDTESQNALDAQQKAAEVALKALYRRRPELKNNEVTVTLGHIEVSLRGISVEQLEAVLDGLHRTKGGPWE